MSQENKTDEKPVRQSRTRRRSNIPVKSILLIVIIICFGFYFYLKKSSRDVVAPYSPGQAMQEITPEADTGRIEIKAGNSEEAPEKEVNEDNGQDPGGADSDGQANEQAAPSAVARQPQTSQPSGDDNDTISFDYQYLHHVKTLNEFYHHLDRQPYMKEFNLPADSKIHFSRLIQQLIDHPPTVTRETDDLFTLLKNTAHFFRILGKENIVVLKGILDREKDSLETMLESFYALTSQPQLLRSEYSINLRSEPLYDYASFLINTMGGRLYLFRRDSSSRMAVTFYAILVIDRANDEGNSRHGIDLRPAISSLIEEMENGGKRLKFRQEYLEKLYTLEEKYN
ncbi:hypothetical protein [Desulforhopalus singaporensis]|nr:hypothetical protein [Desulforhopalus singaporensis]